MVINNLINDDSKGNEEHYKETVSRNMGMKGTASEGSGGNKDPVTGNGTKGDPCYRGAEILAGFCVVVMYKAQLVIINLDIYNS